MKPDKTTVYEFFDRQRRYEVPLYQRQYVWTLDSQWTHLWDDIVDKAISFSSVALRHRTS
jgi:uncharacterized protein with ParB-like and HNH nuclease domain